MVALERRVEEVGGTGRDEDAQRRGMDRATVVGSAAAYKLAGSVVERDAAHFCTGSEDRERCMFRFMLL